MFVSNKDSLINKEMLLSMFDYRDGKLFWKIAKGTALGAEAGSIHKSGYKLTGVNKRLYMNHRLIFLMHYGYLPKHLDHIDGDKTNNRIENLREATHQENIWNRKIHKNNKSGVKGVSWDKTKKKWAAQCMVNKKLHRLGFYKDLEMAKDAVIKFRTIHHGEFCKHN